MAEIMNRRSIFTVLSGAVVAMFSAPKVLASNYPPGEHKDFYMKFDFASYLICPPFEPIGVDWLETYKFIELMRVPKDWDDYAAIADNIKWYHQARESVTGAKPGSHENPLIAQAAPEGWLYEVA